MRVNLVPTAVAVALVAGGGGTAAAAAAAGDAAATRTVRIKDIDFSPRTATVRAGDAVRWTFDDAETPHNVRSKGSPRFKGSPTKQSGAYSVRFARRGTYRYVCTIHLNMKGKVVVR